MKALYGLIFVIAFACLAAPALSVEAQLGRESGERYMAFLESGGTYIYDACTDRPRTFPELVGFLICYINRIIPILIGAALLIFFGGIIRYIAAGGEGGKLKGKDLMLWGVVALFLMVAVFGILQILQTTFGV